MVQDASKLPPREQWAQMPMAERLAHVGHRVFVGGEDPETWYGIGRRQYHYLVSQGLRPHHRFLDIACGSLRLGQYLIPYLEAGHYFGLEAEPALVEAGLAEEILFDLVARKAPRFGFGYGFDFGFVPVFDYAIAQSLFTHLTLEDIGRCMTGLRPAAHRDSRVFFTFFEGDSGNNPDGPSHANLAWLYPFDTLRQTCAEAGWTAQYIGDWGHERNQKMVVAQISA